MSKLIDTSVDAVGDIVLSRADAEIARIDALGNITTKGAVNGGSQPYWLQEKWAGVYGDIRFNSRGVIAIRDDDGLGEAYSVIYPELLSRGLTGSFAIITSYPGTSHNAVVNTTWAQVLEMQQNGMEIMSHSQLHITDPVTDADLAAETTGTLSTFAAQNIFAEGFAQPGSWVASREIASAAMVDGTTVYGSYLRNFAHASAVEGLDDQYAASFGLRALPFSRKYGYDIKIVDTASLVQAKQHVDYLSNYGGGKVFVIHSHNIGLGGFLTLSEFQQLLDYIVLKRDAGLIDVRSCAGLVYAQPGVARNYIGDGDYTLSTTATPVIWEQDPAGPTQTIEIGAGVEGGNAAKVGHTSSYGGLRQNVLCANLRSLEFTAQVKNAVAGGTGVAQVLFGFYDQNSVLLGTQVTKTLACTDSYQTFRITMGNRPDARRLIIWTWAQQDAQPVLFSDVRLVKV